MTTTPLLEAAPASAEVVDVTVITERTAHVATRYYGSPRVLVLARRTTVTETADGISAPRPIVWCVEDFVSHGDVVGELRARGWAALSEWRAYPEGREDRLAAECLVAPSG